MLSVTSCDRPVALAFPGESENSDNTRPGKELKCSKSCIYRNLENELTKNLNAKRFLKCI